MRRPLAALVLCLLVAPASSADPLTGVRPFLEAYCVSCHDSDSKAGGLDLMALSLTADAASVARWARVHDRVAAGEMPPAKMARPPEADSRAMRGTLAGSVVAADRARQARDGRAGVRRLGRLEYENTLRELLAVPHLAVAGELPADGRSLGFDRAAEALDFSFVHMEAYLAAADKALDAATPAFAERPPVFRYRYSPWHANRHEGKECEGSAWLSVREKIGILLNGMTRDDTFDASGNHVIRDHEPKADAIGLFRLEDADYRFTLTAIQPPIDGVYKLRASGYSFGWDGKKVVSTDRHGALGWGIFAKGEHFGTMDLPPNQPAERELTAFLRRGGGLIHGTDDHLRIIGSSCENFRDYAHGKNKDVPGPLTAAPGVAVQWVEIEGPVHDRWPPASQVALFGDLPVKAWTEKSGSPKPVQQYWPHAAPWSFPKDPYGHRNELRPLVHVVPREPAADARRLLAAFLRRAFRRPVTDADLSTYVAVFERESKGGEPFQDALKAAYRAALVAPDTLTLAKTGPHALASRLSYFLWSGPPDDELLSLADSGRLGEPKVLRAQVARMLTDARSRRFVEDFTGQWLRVRDIDATQPDRQLYPEFTPLLKEAMLGETRGYFTELLKQDLGSAYLVKSDFAMLNEPLARLYGIPGVRGHDIRRVSLPEDSVRGGFLTQAAVLKVTANGTTTSPVTRGAFVLEKILGIEPTPPPPGVGSIEPDTRGATTVREQLDKHKRDATCAGCHKHMDPYGFALESFDVVGEQRRAYRVRGGEGPHEKRKYVHGHAIEYRPGPAVDCAGVLPDGRPFANLAELRSLLAADERRLARALLGHLLAYSTGAAASFADRAEVEGILDRSAASKFGARTLIVELVTSPLFARP